MNLKFLAAILLILFWIFVWTILFSTIEPWSLSEAFYFSVSTLTTVWYGDYTPSSDFSRLVTWIYILFWVTTVIWWSMAVIWWEAVIHNAERLQKSVSAKEWKEFMKWRKELNKRIKEIKEEIEEVKDEISDEKKDDKNG